MSIETTHIQRVKCVAEQKKVLKVLWMDAHTEEQLTEAELTDLLQKEGSLLAPYWAVGWQVAETEEVLVIASGILPEEPKFHIDETLYRKILFIPKCLIKGLWELKKNELGSQH